MQFKCSDNENGCMFVDVYRDNGTSIKYRVNYSNKDNYRTFKYIIHVVGSDIDNYVWARNRDGSSYTTALMRDCKLYKTRCFYDPFGPIDFNFVVFILEIIKTLESFNSKIDNLLLTKN